MGTDLGLSLSLSSSATSGASVDNKKTINNGGGLKISPWFLFGAIGAAVLVLLAWVFTHHN